MQHSAEENFAFLPSFVNLCPIVYNLTQATRTVSGAQPGTQQSLSSQHAQETRPSGSGRQQMHRTHPSGNAPTCSREDTNAPSAVLPGLRTVGSSPQDPLTPPPVSGSGTRKKTEVKEVISLMSFLLEEKKDLSLMKRERGQDRNMRDTGSAFLLLEGWQCSFKT